METALSLIISNGDFPEKSLKHLLFLALKSKEMVECQEEGYQLQISNQGPGLSSAGSLAIIATHELARGEKPEGNSTKYTHAHLNAGGSWRKITSTSGKHTISIPQAGSSPEGCYTNTQSSWAGSRSCLSLLSPFSPHGRDTSLWQQLWCAWFRN